MVRNIGLLVLACGLLFNAKSDYLNPIEDIHAIESGAKTINSVKEFGFVVKDLWYSGSQFFNYSQLTEMRRAMNAADEMFYNSKVASGLMKSSQKDGAFGTVVNGLIDDTKSSRAWGIASAGVAKYMKVRTAVRYAYEEIQLWKGVIEEYNNVKKFFKEFAGKVDSLGDNAHALFMRGEGRGFVKKLEMFVGLYDQVDDLKNMPKTLNARLMGLENKWDTFASDTFSYSFGPWTTKLNVTPGVIIPNSATIFDTLLTGTIDNKYVDWLADQTNPNWRAQQARETPIGQRTLNLEIDSLGRQYDTRAVDTLSPGDPFRYYTLPIMSNEVLLASALARSNSYLAWAQRSMSKMNDLDEKLNRVVASDTSAGGVNGMEFAATWYMIETVNAKNKLLRHSVEETKLLTALVGTDLHLRSTFREAELSQAVDFKFQSTPP